MMKQDVAATSPGLPERHPMQTARPRSQHESPRGSRLGGFFRWPPRDTGLTAPSRRQERRGRTRGHCREAAAQALLAVSGFGDEEFKNIVIGLVRYRTFAMKSQFILY
jgi:hypothetical protein